MMNLKVFKIAQSDWPFENLLHETQRRKKLENLKALFMRQLRIFRSEAEEGIMSSQAVLEKIELCKRNIVKTNRLITGYNQLGLHFQPIKTLPIINFNLWKTRFQTVIPEDIIHHISKHLDYHTLYAWSRICKSARQYVSGDAVLVFCSRLALVEQYIIRHKKTLRDDELLKYKLFDTVIEKIKVYAQEYKISKQDRKHISEEIYIVACNNCDLRRFEDTFLLFAVRLLLLGMEGKTLKDPEVQKFIAKSLKIPIYCDIENIELFLHAPHKAYKAYLEISFKNQIENTLRQLDNSESS